MILPFSLLPSAPIFNLGPHPPHLPTSCSSSLPMLLLRYLSIHMKSRPYAHFWRARKNSIYNMKMTNFIQTSFDKSGCISLNNGAIWKIEKVAYSGDRANPAGWTRPQICPPHAFSFILDRRTGFIWNTAITSSTYCLFSSKSP